MNLLSLTNYFFFHFLGALQLFQPKGEYDSLETPKASLSQFPVPIEPQKPKVSGVDPFISRLFEGPEITCNAVPQDISWDEKQEQARVARERKR